MTRTDYIAFLEERRSMLTAYSKWCAEMYHNHGVLADRTDIEEDCAETDARTFAKLMEQIDVAIAISFKERADRLADGQMEQGELTFAGEVMRPLWYIREQARAERSDDASRAEDMDAANADPDDQVRQMAQFAAREAEMNPGTMPHSAIEAAQADEANRRTRRGRKANEARHG